MNGEDRADYDKTKEIVLEAYKIGPTEYRRRYFEGSLDMKSPRKWCRWHSLVCEWQGPYEVICESYMLIFYVTIFCYLNRKLTLFPYAVVEKNSPVTYVIDVSDSRKRLRTFHINTLKEWVSPVPAVLRVAKSEEVGPLTWQDESTEEPPKSNLTPEQ